jgi:hypothetical protein
VGIAASVASLFWRPLSPFKLFEVYHRPLDARVTLARAFGGLPHDQCHKFPARAIICGAKHPYNSGSCRTTKTGAGYRLAAYPCLHYREEPVIRRPLGGLLKSYERAAALQSAEFQNIIGGATCL